MVLKKFRIIPKRDLTPRELIIRNDMLAAQRVRNINIKFDMATKSITRWRR